MASRRFTASERAWPDTPEFTAIARRWNQRAIEILFDHVWRGYDLLRVEVLPLIDWTTVADDIERDITEHLELRMRRRMTGHEPFGVQHGRHERESRKPAPAQPPQYDIAFFLYAYPRVSLPLEAKVLHTDQEMAAYVGDLREEFLKCRYAPFSAEGAMVAYLLSGTADAVFESIARTVPCDLRAHNVFATRPHRYSDHTRTVERGKSYPRHFRCHHLVFAMITAP